METKKAGCILVNKDNQKIALIYRDRQKDYSFPKGHLEKGETLMQCAIRETAEETKRDAVVVSEIEPIEERYTTPKGERCVCYWYVAIDCGHSDNQSPDVHELVWTAFDDVANVLTYPSSIEVWNNVKDFVKNILVNKK